MSSPTASALPASRPALPSRAAAVPDPAGFGSRPDISARSVLVTIFGDSVVPAGGEIWLGDLIELCQQFGFSDRLIRTSMFRLGAEGWFEVERVGRRSRYRLTSWALEEFTAAEARIYGPIDRPWDRHWTLVFPDAGAEDRRAADTLRDLLAADGFAPMVGGVLASPRLSPGRVAERARQAGFIGSAVTARAQFEEFGPLAAAGWPVTAFGLGPVAERYGTFIERYGPLLTGPPSAAPAGPDGEAAFGLRTMVVHEWRRARLADPDLPAELLPPDWPAPSARAVAAGLYHRAAGPAQAWLSAVTSLTVDPSRVHPRFP